MKDNIVLKFFIENFPTWKEILLGGPISILWAFACLTFAGYIKRYKNLKTGYTRKIFHFFIFFTASFIHLRWGLSILCLFGGMTSLVIFYALFQGSGDLLYEAIAREKDSPHRTYYIIIPYLATLIGGIASNMLFGSFAIAGYLVTGLADAIAEPVGTRWGKHVYRAPSFRRVKSVRSLEGSTAVLIASFISLLLAVSIISETYYSFHVLQTLMVVSIICTLTEAISPHGWDNLSLQIVPAFLLSSFFA